MKTKHQRVRGAAMLLGFDRVDPARQAWIAARLARIRKQIDELGRRGRPIGWEVEASVMIALEIEMLRFNREGGSLMIH